MTEELKSKIVWQENKDFGKVCTLTESALNDIINEATKELQEELEQAKKVKVVEHFEAFGQCRDSRQIADLEKQIEKMKCCYNCSKWNDGECEESPKSKTFFCADFKCENWECIK